MADNGTKKGEIMDKWRSVDNLDTEDFTLRWKYPSPDLMKVEVTSFVENEPKIRSISKGNKVKGQSGVPNGRVLEMFNDYCQNRFCKNSKASGGLRESGSPVSSGASTSIFSKYSKKSLQCPYWKESRSSRQR